MNVHDDDADDGGDNYDITALSSRILSDDSDIH